MELGDKFKRIRKQRHLTLSHLAKIAGSVASISDFENGKSSLTNDTLFKLLRHMKVEYNEFFDHDYLVDQSYVQMSNRFNLAANQRDVPTLKSVASDFLEAGQKNNIDRLIGLAICCYTHSLQQRKPDNNTLKELLDYFFTVNIWTIVDINLLDMVKEHITTDTLTLFTKEIIHNLGFPLRNNLDRIKIDVVSHFVFQLILNNEKRESQIFLKHLTQLKLPDYFLLQKLYFKELKAAFLYKFENKNEGQDLHKHILGYLRFIGEENIALDWDTEFEQL